MVRFNNTLKILKNINKNNLNSFNVILNNKKSYNFILKNINKNNLNSFNVILNNKKSYNFILKNTENLVINNNLIKIDDKKSILKYIDIYNINFYIDRKFKLENVNNEIQNKIDNKNTFNNIISNH